MLRAGATGGLTIAASQMGNRSLTQWATPFQPVPIRSAEQDYPMTSKARPQPTCSVRQLIMYVARGEHRPSLGRPYPVSQPVLNPTPAVPKFSPAFDEFLLALTAFWRFLSLTRNASLQVRVWFLHTPLVPANKGISSTFIAMRNKSRLI